MANEVSPAPTRTAPQVAPGGLREFGRGYWADFLAQPTVAFIECVK